MEKLKTELKKAIKRTNDKIQDNKNEFPEFWYYEGQMHALLSVLNSINKYNEEE